MELYVLALLIGIVAGLRTMTAPAAISWAAYLNWLPLGDTFLAFLGAEVTPYIVTALALGELVADKLPQTRSRKVPMQFGTRLFMGAACGGAIGLPMGALWGGLFAGLIGAAAGTLIGAALRARLAKTFSKDMPAALIEDIVAVGGAVLIVSAL